MAFKVYAFTSCKKLAIFEVSSERTVEETEATLHKVCNNFLMYTFLDLMFLQPYLEL